jgi:hypothetical protein
MTAFALSALALWPAIVSLLEERDLERQVLDLLPPHSRIVKVVPQVTRVVDPPAGQVLYTLTDGSIVYRTLVHDPSGLRLGPSMRILGTAVDPAPLPKALRELLPADEVLLDVHVFASPGFRHYLVLTRTLSTTNPRPAGSVFSYRLYTEDQQGRFVTAVMEEGDLSLKQVCLVTLGENRPGFAIAGRGETGVSQWLSVWRVDGDSARRVGFDHYTGLWPTVVSADPLTIVTFQERTLEVAASYVWETQSERFLPFGGVVCGGEQRSRIFPFPAPSRGRYGRQHHPGAGGLLLLSAKRG